MENYKKILKKKHRHSLETTTFFKNGKGKYDIFPTEEINSWIREKDIEFENYKENKILNK